MITTDIYLPKLVSDYIAHDFSPIPIQNKSKRPVNIGWPDLKISTNDIGTYFNGDSINIGILTGQASKGLVDVDIDDPAALPFAPRFLPETKCIFGRASKPNSHWVYRVPDSQTQEIFQSAGMIVEVRGNKRCTVFPGSIHESGEPIEFEDAENYDPSPSTWSELRKAASKIAIATELFKAWAPGKRHKLTLGAAAKLARLGWNIDDVRILIEAVATEANDEELDDRLLAVKTTFDEYDQGQPITKEENFSELIGETAARSIHKWASSGSLKQSPKSTSRANAQSTATADLFSDSGAADAFAAKFENDLIHCGEDRGWFLRNNRVFEPAEPAIVQGLAKGFLQNEVGKVTGDLSPTLL